MVSAADGVFIVLYDNNRVAKIPQARQGVEQSFIIALVQADARFIENVHHTDQTGTNLTGQSDALSFTARECVGAAIQRQVV